MTLIYNTLRNNLLALFAWLGVMALGVLLWNLGTAVSEHFRIQGELSRGAETDALIRLSYDLRREDMATFQALSGETPIVSMAEASRSTDEALAETVEHLSAHGTGEHKVSLTMLSALRSGIGEKRNIARLALKGDRSERDAALRSWRRYLDAAYPHLEDLSHDLLTEAGKPDPQLAQITSLRYYALFAFRVLIANRFAIEKALRDEQTSGSRAILLSQSSAQLRGAANFAEDQFLSESGPAFVKIAFATNSLLTGYLPAELRVLNAIDSGKPTKETIGKWRIASQKVVLHLTIAETALAAEAQERLMLAEKRDHAAILLWSIAVALALTLLVSAIHFSLNRIVKPLEKLHSNMLRLANEELFIDLGSRPKLAEIQAMHDALLVFREKGQRRVMMQAEVARLNDRVVIANQTMVEELEAAARVQAAQLPDPCDLAGARFFTHYRPSHMIAGDTYDFVTLPDGRTRLFQIDVSGHGAAAALVSVMSHIAVKSAIVQAAPTDRLSDIVSRVNREWNERLPYFTLLLVEIDPRNKTACVVQAGHPPLLRLPQVGGVEMIGDGGMPVGALRWAEYEEMTCAFHPGDRLVLTTDGVTEAADADGTLFGDDRYLGLLANHAKSEVKAIFDNIDTALWDWCGTEAFEDDVTVIVLEAKEPAYAH